MKKKSLILFFACIIGLDGFAQTFNSMSWGAYDYGFDNLIQNTTSTVTCDNQGNIFFLASGVFGSPQIIKFSSIGSYIAGVDITESLGAQWGWGAGLIRLNSKALINTYDDGIILVGNFHGTHPNFPSGFPTPIGGVQDMMAVYIAKFDNNLNLITFKVIAGYPLISPNGTTYARAVDIISVPNATDEDYYLLSHTENSIMSVSPQVAIVTKFNSSLATVNEKYLTITNQSEFLPLHIDYLPVTKALAINGLYIDNSIFKPAITLIDENLNQLSQLSIVRHPVLTTYWHVTNTIEDLQQPGNIIWAFQNERLEDSDCFSDDERIYLLKQDVINLNHVDNRELRFCNRPSTNPIELSTINNESDLGFVLEVTSGGASAHNWSNTGLVNFAYNLSPTQYHIYDHADGQNYSSRALSLINYQENLILHTQGNGNLFTGLVKADKNGFSDCSSQEPVFDYQIEPIIEPIEVSWVQSGAELYSVTPLIEDIEYESYLCSTSNKNAHVLSTLTKSKSSLKFDVFPNPAAQTLNVQSSIGGDTYFILEDLMGRSLIQQNSNGKSRTTFDISNAPNGMYILKIYSEEKLLQTEKIIIDN